MEKTSKLLRRSGVRIRSIGSGHSDLQMVISQLKDFRLAAKTFSTAQSSCVQDLVKWSLKDENRAIQDALTQVGELVSILGEINRDFCENIKEFRHHFEMILEGARQLDLARGELQQAELRESKIKKELKKAAKKAPAEELREMSARLDEAEREKGLALLEVGDRAREHEAVKMIRVKEGLFKFSEAYIDYSQKCDVIFQAQRDIALQIPDVQDKDIQDIKYTGAGSTMLAVSRAKEKIKRFRRRDCSLAPRESSPTCPTPESGLSDLPPPYSENPPVNPFYNDLPRNISTSSIAQSFGGLDEVGGGVPGEAPRLSPSLYPGRRYSQAAQPNFYPLLPNIPPYIHQVNPLGGQIVLPSDPPAFHSLSGESGHETGRAWRDSYYSDTDEGVGPRHTNNLQLNVNMRNLNL